MWRESKTYAGMDESRIHMTGSRLYDCIIRACEHDDDIDDACNGITDLIRAIIIALPSLPKGVITADCISENMMHPIEFNIEQLKTMSVQEPDDNEN